MALWAKAVSTRTTHLLELSRRHVHWRWHCNQRSQNSHTFHTMKESLTTDTRRTPRSQEMYAEGLGVHILAWNKWQHPRSCGKMWHMPIEFQSSQALRECQRSSTTPMAHLRHWLVLLEQDWLPCDRWLLHQIHHCAKTSKQFHACRDQRTWNGLYWIWPTIQTEKWQWTVLQFQGVPWVLSSAPHHEQPTSSMEQWLCWGSCGHCQEVDGKSHQRWETMELRIAAVLSNFDFQYHPITVRSPHWMKTVDFASTNPLINWENCGQL